VQICRERVSCSRARVRVLGRLGLWLDLAWLDLAWLGLAWLGLARLGLAWGAGPAVDIAKHGKPAELAQ